MAGNLSCFLHQEKIILMINGAVKKELQNSDFTASSYCGKLETGNLPKSTDE